MSNFDRKHDLGLLSRDELVLLMHGMNALCRSLYEEGDDYTLEDARLLSYRVGFLLDEIERKKDE